MLIILLLISMVFSFSPTLLLCHVTFIRRGAVGPVPRAEPGCGGGDKQDSAGEEMWGVSPDAALPQGSWEHPACAWCPPPTPCPGGRHRYSQQGRAVGRQPPLTAPGCGWPQGHPLHQSACFWVCLLPTEACLLKSKTFWIFCIETFTKNGCMVFFSIFRYLFMNL